jgi:hypothetical protein
MRALKPAKGLVVDTGSMISRTSWLRFLVRRENISTPSPSPLPASVLMSLRCLAEGLPAVAEAAASAHSAPLNMRCASTAARASTSPSAAAPRSRNTSALSTPCTPPSPALARRILTRRGCLLLHRRRQRRRRRRRCAAAANNAAAADAAAAAAGCRRRRRND